MGIVPAGSSLLLLLVVAPFVSTARAQSTAARNLGSRIVHYDVQLDPSLEPGND